MIQPVSMTLHGGYLKNNDKRIAFRVDASKQIGTGHFMRCLTLADELKRRGSDIRFISRELPLHLHDMLTAKDIELAPLDSDTSDVSIDNLPHSHWLGTSQTQDVRATIQELSDQNWDWIVVDHYALDCRWESMMRQTTRKILVIDDIADRRHDCDVLLDQNFYVDMQTRYIGKVPTHCQCLLGPSHALLRREFRLLHEQIKPRSGSVKRILVFFGGVDADNYSGHAIEALSQINVPDLQVDVVIGAQHPCRERIKTSCLEHGFICHVQTDKMAELMLKADLAIGASGSASWERCCLGLPALLLAVADNQINIAKALDQLDASIYIESPNKINPQIIRNALLNTLSMQDKLKIISEKAYELVDGLGVNRVCQIMGC